MRLPRPHPDVVAQAIDDEVVLVHLPSNAIYSLNRTGARFWSLLSAGMDRDDIVTALTAEFAVGEDEVTAEMDAMLESLAAAGLLVAER